MKIYLVVESDISFTFDSQHEPAPDERVIKSYFVRRIGPRGSATDTNKVGIFYRYRVKIFFFTQNIFYCQIMSGFRWCIRLSFNGIYNDRCRKLLDMEIYPI